MKVSRFVFPKQGENNRETYATCGCGSSDVPQHFGNTHPGPRGRRSRRHKLRRKYDVQTV